MRILRDRSLAEDAVHDAFEQLWRQRERIDTARGRVDALALTVVRRRALDLARASGRRTRREAELPATFDLADPAAEDVATLLTRGVEARQVRAALGALPAAQRSAASSSWRTSRG